MGKYVGKRGSKNRGRSLNKISVPSVPKVVEERFSAGECDSSQLQSSVELSADSSNENVNMHVRPSVSTAMLWGSRQNTLPYKLRASTTSNGANIVDGANETDLPFIAGYRIVSLYQMEMCMNEFLIKHSQASPLCIPQIHFLAQGEQIRGMCITEVLTCTTCHYTSVPCQLYSEVATTEGQTKGRKAGDLNVRLALGILHTGIGMREDRELFAVLDLPVPSASSLQSMCNKASDMLVILSNEVMAENRQKVKNVMHVWNDKKLIVESDTSYNNPIKGRSFHQPGTQAFCPLVEQVTYKKLIVAYNIKNKLCKRCQLYGKNHDGVCSANYCKSEPIGNAEVALGRDNMDDLLKDPAGLVPTTVVTDNDGKILKGMNDALKTKFPMETIQKEDCGIHVSRGQRRKCMAQPWSVQFAGKKNTPIRQRFIQDLTNAVVKRCSGEMKAIKLFASGKDFVSTVQQAKDTIIPCFTGNHTACKMSYVCPAHFGRTAHARHLPGKKSLSGMTVSDVKHLKGVIDYKLSCSMIARHHTPRHKYQET